MTVTLFTTIGSLEYKLNTSKIEINLKSTDVMNVEYHQMPPGGELTEMLALNRAKAPYENY